MIKKAVLAIGTTTAATLLLTGCLAKPAASPAAAPVAAAPAAMGHMEVVAAYADDLSDYGRTVVVPTAYVKVLVQGRTVVTQPGNSLQTLGGGKPNAVEAIASYRVAGMDKALAQSLARQAYDDFVAKLRAAGFTVLTYDDVKARYYVQVAVRDKADPAWGMPVEAPQGSGNVYLVAAPSDEQQFRIGLTGVFTEFMNRGLSKFDDAVVVIPTYTLVAPQVWGETGTGYKTISAKLNAQPGMSLQYASATWLGRSRLRSTGGKAAGVVLRNPVANLSPRAGELVRTADTTPTASNTLSKALSLLTGAGRTHTTSVEYAFTIDRNAYEAGAMTGIGTFNDAVATFAATAR